MYYYFFFKIFDMPSDIRILSQIVEIKKKFYLVYILFFLYDEV